MSKQIISRETLKELACLRPHSAWLRLSPERGAVRILHARVPPLHVGRVVVTGPAGHAAAPALGTTAAAPVLVGKGRRRLLRLSRPAPATVGSAAAAGHHVEASAAAGHRVAPVRGGIRRRTAGIGFPLIGMGFAFWKRNSFCHILLIKYNHQRSKISVLHDIT